MKRKRRLWEIIAPNPSVRYGMAEKLNVGHWMKVETPYGKKLQVYEHGIGKEGGTSILLRHGYTGGMRSVSHDPAEYLVEVSNATGMKKSERVLFTHTDREIVTIDGNGSVGQYSVEEVFAKIGFSGEWWYRRIVTNVTRNLGIIFIWVRPSTYWYIVDKDFNVILSGVLDGYDVVLYTYYNNKLRVTMSNWDDDTYTWAEWTKDGIQRTGPIDYNFLDIAGRYCIAKDSEYIRFIDYETGDIVSHKLLNRWCIIRVKSVGYNQFRVYVVYWYMPAMFKFRELLNRLPGVGSYLSFEELMSEPDAVVYEFYINDRDVRFEGKVSGDQSGNIISRKDASVYGAYSYNGSLCKWVSRGSTPPYFGSMVSYKWYSNYDDGTVLLPLNIIDYNSDFTLSKDNVAIYSKADYLYSEYQIRLATENREIWFKGSSANDVISGASLVSFNPDTGEAYIVLTLENTNEKVYFKVTRNRIERVEGYAYYQLVYIAERPNYLIFQPQDPVARCYNIGEFHVFLSIYIDNCSDVDPGLLSEALNEASYVSSFYGGIIGSPYDVVCTGFYVICLLEVSLSYYRHAYLLHFARQGSYTTVSHNGELAPYYAFYRKSIIPRVIGSYPYYESTRRVVYNDLPPLRGIDKDYECSGYDVKIGNYWYSRYLAIKNSPTFVFKAIDRNKYLIYGLGGLVLLYNNNTFKSLRCNTFNSTLKIILNRKAFIEVGEIRSIVASDGKNVRWIGKLNGVEGEYLNDRLLFRNSVEYIGGGCNFAAIRRRENTEWVTYIADVNTLMAGENGVVLDKVQWDFYDFDAQDVFVFGTSGIKLRNVR